MYTLQCTTNAQILKADAIGPKVPAINGNAVLANHHRLFTISARIGVTLGGRFTLAVGVHPHLLPRSYPQVLPHSLPFSHRPILVYQGLGRSYFATLRGTTGGETSFRGKHPQWDLSNQ